MADVKNINEVLLAVQRMNIVLAKTASGAVRSGKVDKYADLEAVNNSVLAALNSLDTIWTCSPTMKDGEFVLSYDLRHVPSDTGKTGDYPIGKAAPQAMGSGITYSRRYALLAITGVAARDDDDDGQGGRGRSGYAQRSNSEPRPPAERPPTVRRGAADVARPAEHPPLPAPTSPAPASPAPADEPARGRGGLITLPMTKKLAVSMKQALGDDTATRKQYIVDMIGREVASSKDLTFDEGRGLIDAFEKANQDPDTAAATVIDIYRRTTGAAPAPDVDPDLIAAIKAGQWKKVQFYADDPGGYGPNIDAAKGALAGANVRPETSGRQQGQRSRNAAEAIGTGDVGTEQAPWEQEAPIG
jgi:hypothetical protein